ncbi:Smr/MutS family protein [Candidatus Peregrinibacteria bacterium]|nr:Smr/MutS family protein [Candidatus Peregrinibacteria bacterium]
MSKKSRKPSNSPKNGILNLDEPTNNRRRDLFEILLAEEGNADKNNEVPPDVSDDFFEELLDSQTDGEMSKLLREKKPIKSKKPNRNAIVKVLKHHHPIQSTCDLHDLNWEDAERKIRQTVSDAYSFGFKKILIITGKGKRSQNGKPVLLPRTAVLLQMMKKEKRILDFELDKKGETRGGGYIVYLK